jgi:hypothetical protein
MDEIDKLRDTLKPSSAPLRPNIVQIAKRTIFNVQNPLRVYLAGKIAPKTIAEIGFAYGVKKPVYLLYGDKITAAQRANFWFVEQFSKRTTASVSSKPSTAFCELTLRSNYPTNLQRSLDRYQEQPRRKRDD